MEGSEVAVGASGDGGGFFSNKRNLILLAAAIGGVAGLVILMSRRASSGSSPATSAAAGGTPYTQTDLQLGNIAQQLLQLRGEQSQSFADVGTSLSTGFGTVGQAVAQGQYLNQDYYNALAGASNTLLDVNAANNRGIEMLLEYFNEHPTSDPSAFTTWLQAQSQPITPPPVDSTVNKSTVAVNQAKVGAGGFTAEDYLPTMFDGGDGSATDWTALMATGPVRYIGLN